MEQEERNRRSVAALVLSAIPSAALMGIGAEWSAMSSALATMSVIATALITLGCITAASIRLNW